MFEKERERKKNNAGDGKYSVDYSVANGITNKHPRVIAKSFFQHTVRGMLGIMDVFAGLVRNVNRLDRVSINQIY